MTIFVTSDLHFNHRNIIGFCSRPFETVEEMNAGIIERWQSIVRPHDPVFVLGDFGFRNGIAPLEEIFDSLPGEKHLIVGNHDEHNPKALALPWASQAHYRRLRVGGNFGGRAILSHYPFATWDGAGHGTIHLHGHSHGGLVQIPHRYDVGVDAMGIYTPDMRWGTPIPVEHFFNRARQETYEPQDHHGADR